MPPVAHPGGSRPQGEADDEQAEEQGPRVGQHVSRVREEREAVRIPAGREFDAHEEQSQDERPRKAGSPAGPGMAVTMPMVVMPVGVFLRGMVVIV